MPLVWKSFETFDEILTENFTLNSKIIDYVTSKYPIMLNYLTDEGVLEIKMMFEELILADSMPDNNLFIYVYFPNGIC